jgi:hypothetical protein
MNISTAYFNLVDSELKGRCVCCVKPISAGTIILNEPTLATVLYGPSRNIFCSFCTARLENSFFFFYLS